MGLHTFGRAASSVRMGSKGAFVSWMLLPASLLFGIAAQAQTPAAGTAAPAGGAAATQEATSPVGLEEVVVTAQKRAQNLQDVPIAVTVATATQIQAANIISTNDLPTLVSGLTMPATGNDLVPHLRGVGTISFGPNVENPVALYVDGVYYPSQVEAPKDLIDVTQVSVLKGPQGTLFGRNATGGVIQMTTRDPENSFGGEVFTSLDNYITSRNFVYLTDRFSPAVAANASFRYTTQGNAWGDNTFTGQQVGRIGKDLAARNKWLFTLSDATTIRLNLDYTNTASSFGLNFAPLAGTKPLFPGYVPSSNPYDIDTYETTFNSQETAGASLHIEHSLGFADLVSITSARTYELEVPHFVVSLTPVPGIDLQSHQNGHDYTQDLQLISKNSTSIQWATGVYYFYEQGGAISNTYLRGILTPTPFSFGQQASNSSLHTTSVALYAQATFQLSQRWDLTVGARETWEDRTIHGLVLGYLANGIPIGPLAPYIDESMKVTLPSYRAAVDYKVADNVLAYVSYNRSFKSGGFNGGNPTNPPYRPETLNAYEIGLKSETEDHRLRANLAAFYYDYKNLQVTNFIGSVTNIYNGAAARLYGADLDLNWKATESFRLSGTAEWLHSEFTDFPQADFSTALPNGGVAIYTASAEGNRLPYAPTFTASVSADYLVPVGKGQLDFNVTNYYNNGFYTEPDNFLHQPSYDYLNASVNWSFFDGRVNLKLWGSNLLDKVVESQLVTGPPEGYAIVNANPPRTYGFTASYQF